MDAERQNEQATQATRAVRSAEAAEVKQPEPGYANVSPQFVWELELAHTKAAAKAAKETKPATAARPEQAPRPASRRRVLLPVCVAVAVLAGGAYGFVDLDGHGDSAKTDSPRAAEVGSAEFPRSGIPGASQSATSDATRKAIVPVRHPSKTPTRPGTSPDATSSVDSVHGVTVSSAPAQQSAGAGVVPAAPVTTASTPAMPSVVEALSDQWGQCAQLNGSCSVSLPSVVALGANGYFNYGTFSNATGCNYTVFGNPNASGQIACYSEPTPSASSDVWTECASENGTCNYSGVMTIAFGANGDYNYATLGGGGAACTDTVFGDPAYGTAKACYMMAPPPQFTHWDLCATNGGTCTFSGTEEVAYGADGRYTYGSHTSSTPCTTSALGNPEASGTTYCYAQDYYQY